MEREPGHRVGSPGDRTGKSPLVTETVLTAILVPVILNAATGARSIRHNAAIAVGSTVALLGLFASPISGASMNPARTLGPNIVGETAPPSGQVYVAGPVIGAALAVMIIGPRVRRGCRSAPRPAVGSRSRRQRRPPGAGPLSACAGAPNRPGALPCRGGARPIQRPLRDG